MPLIQHVFKVVLFQFGHIIDILKKKKKSGWKAHADVLGIKKNSIPNERQTAAWKGNKFKVIPEKSDVLLKVLFITLNHHRH